LAKKTKLDIIERHHILDKCWKNNLIMK
jgi:hypothetical protein